MATSAAVDTAAADTGGAGQADASTVPAVTAVCPQVAVAGLEGELARFNGVYELWVGKVNDGAPVWRAIDTTVYDSSTHASSASADVEDRGAFCLYA